MSKYSGKCDFYDWIDIHGLDNVLASKIYIGNNPVPLRIDSKKDCVPYYAHLVTLAHTMNNMGSITLSTKSYIDTQEEEHLNWVLNAALRYYNKCKRSKISFNEEECLKRICLFEDTPKEYEVETVHRVAMYGKKADIQGVHCDYSNREREMLYEEMINNGYPHIVAHSWLWHALVLI